MARPASREGGGRLNLQQMRSVRRSAPPWRSHKQVVLTSTFEHATCAFRCISPGCAFKGSWAFFGFLRNWVQPRVSAAGELEV